MYKTLQEEIPRILKMNGKTTQKPVSGAALEIQTKTLAEHKDPEKLGTRPYST